MNYFYNVENGSIGLLQGFNSIYQRASNSYFQFTTQLDQDMGKPVGPRFGQMVLYAKFRTRVNFVPESIAFTICEN